MNPGELREVVEVVQFSVARAPSGAPVKTPTVANTVRAKVEVKTGEEMPATAGGTVLARTQYHFLMRWPMSPEVKEKDILRWGGVDYAVVSVEPQESGLNRHVLVKAVRGPTNG